MASLFNPRPRHLDANCGREVVYCHSCSHEWYRDESPSLSLVCPSCRGEIAEIVEANNDPRFENGIASLSRFFGNRGGTDSDPEEDDIANVVGGSRSPPLSPDRRPFNDGDRLGVPPGSDVLSRFIEMMMDDLGGGRVVRDAQGPGGLFGPNFTTEQRGGTRIHHRTYTSGPNTTTSVTFTTGPMPIDGPAANFGTLFGSLMGTQPLDANNGNRSPRAGDPPGLGGPPPFRFGHLLASILSPGGFNGDAVYSQEELDRIITQLMEHTPSNAAPPASQSAIESLEKKIVDDEMLGSDGRAECTICIDELKKGDEVTVLPCTHWYHGECVILWLKEHNTCPICRKPVEAQDAGANNSGQRSPRSPGLQQSDAGPSFTASPRSPQSEGSRSIETPLPNWLRASTQRSDQIRREMERDREGQPSRQANPNSQEDIRRRRLERIRQAAGFPSEESPAGSSSQRRSSVSPPGAWPDSPFQSRVRSPSFSHTRENEGTYFGSSPSSRLFESRASNRRSYAAPSREQREAQQNSNNSSDNGNSGGGGLFGWVRDHFGRNSGNNSDRDRRR